MLFQATVDIPASTDELSPVKQTLKIANGIITEFKVRPRPGHNGLAHLRIRHHTAIIAPSIEGMDLHGDKDPIDWSDYYESYQPPYELVLEAWNDDTLYQHSFDVYVAIMPRRAIIALAIADTLRGFLNMISPVRIFTRSQ